VKEVRVETKSQPVEERKGILETIEEDKEVNKEG
jgi:hypothetical protein